MRIRPDDDRFWFKRRLIFFSGGIPVPLLFSAAASTSTTKDRACQTDFPAGMLEDYVVRNRKRILKMLGQTQQQGENGGNINNLAHLDS